MIETLAANLSNAPLAHLRARWQVVTFGCLGSRGMVGIRMVGDPSLLVCRACVYYHCRHRKRLVARGGIKRMSGTMLNVTLFWVAETSSTNFRGGTITLPVRVAVDPGCHIERGKIGFFAYFRLGAEFGSVEVVGSGNISSVVGETTVRCGEGTVVVSIGNASLSASASEFGRSSKVLLSSCSAVGRGSSEVFSAVDTSS